MMNAVLNEIIIVLVENKQILTLEDQLYLLEKAELSPSSKEKLRKANIYFEQGEDKLSHSLISEIKEECDYLGISIELPKNSCGYVWN